MIPLLRILPVWQNFEAELERARTHCTCLPEATRLSPRRVQCEQLLKNVETALARSYPPQLYIWLTFHELYQNLLWLQSPPELLQQWITLSDRVRRIDKAERGTWDDEHLKGINAEVEAALKDDTQSARARAELRTLRKFLDDRTDSALWQTHAFNEGLVVAIVLLVVLLGALSALLYDHNGQTSVALLPTICASMLGGTLSTLLALRDRELQGPPLARTYWLRPVIAAAAGLIFWLIQRVDTINVVPIASYVLAIAFGFSERLFVSALQKISGQAEEQIAKVSGFGRSDEN